MIECGCERGDDIIMNTKKEQPICPKCKSKDIRARLKTKELWCRRCGYIGKKEEFYNKKGNDKNVY